MALDEHQLDEDGEHDPDECEVCLERDLGHSGTCGCGRCCEQLIVEASLRDAEREPRIARQGSPIKDPFFPAETVGYLLNDVRRGYCTFFDPSSHRCTIYETRPLVCRAFRCDEWAPANPPGPTSTLSWEERHAIVRRIRLAIAVAHECASTLPDQEVLQLAYGVAASIGEPYSLGHITSLQWRELIDALWAPGTRLHALVEARGNRRS